MSTEHPTKTDKVSFVTCDVQKFNLWWTAREWSYRPRAEGVAGPVQAFESRLLDFGNCTTFGELDAVAGKANAARVLVDSGYAERIGEVYGACAQFNLIPTKGVGGRTMKLPWTQSTINPAEGITGSRGGAQNILLIQFHADTFKSRLYEMVCGRVAGLDWSVYKNIDREYVAQMTSEEKSDGTWKLKRGRRDNHLWDCEVLQVLATDVFIQ